MSYQNNRRLNNRGRFNVNNFKSRGFPKNNFKKSFTITLQRNEDDVHRQIDTHMEDDDNNEFDIPEFVEPCIQNNLEENVSNRDLYIEYIQWDFINNSLYNLGESMLHIEERSKQEFTNTLQRWFIYINEHFNFVPKYEYFPILPDISVNHEAAQFLRDAFIEKKFVYHNGATSAVNQLLRTIRTRHTEVAAFDENKLLNLKFDYKRQQVTVNKFTSPEVPRVALLVKRGGLVAAARMLLRYESFGNGSYQWGDPKEVHKVLYDRFGVRYEGFASPVNSRFIEYEDTFFCSLFPETDEPFGSLGNFFHVDIEKHCGGWSVNPPFLNDLMKRVADRMIEILDEGHDYYFFCTFPCWTDDDGWQTLNSCRHLHKRFDLKPSHFKVQDAYGRKFEPRMAMTMFVLGHLPYNCKLTDLGNILIMNHHESLPDQCPW